MTLTDFEVSSIEKTHRWKHQQYTIILKFQPEFFLAEFGLQNWRQEDVFSKEAMISNKAYLGTNRTNPFQYQNVQLNEIIVYQNGLPIARTPVSATHNK